MVVVDVDVVYGSHSHSHSHGHSHTGSHTVYYCMDMTLYGYDTVYTIHFSLFSLFPLFPLSSLVLPILTLSSSLLPLQSDLTGNPLLKMPPRPKKHVPEKDLYGADFSLKYIFNLSYQSVCTLQFAHQFAGHPKSTPRAPPPPRPPPRKRAKRTMSLHCASMASHVKSLHLEGQLEQTLKVKRC